MLTWHSHYCVLTPLVWRTMSAMVSQFMGADAAGLQQKNRQTRHYWPIVKGIYRRPMDFPHNGQYGNCGHVTTLLSLTQFLTFVLKFGFEPRLFLLVGRDFGLQFRDLIALCCRGMPQVPRLAECLQVMMTSSNGNIFRATGPMYRSPVNSPHKGQWHEALIFFSSAPWINGWINNREAGDLRRHRAHYYVVVMWTQQNFDLGN